MKMSEMEKWRRELEEPKKEIIIPTQKERVELGLSKQEATLICYIKHRNGKCFRESNAHSLCISCPKSGRVKISEELAKQIENLAAETSKKLARRRKRAFYRR